MFLIINHVFGLSHHMRYPQAELWLHDLMPQRHEFLAAPWHPYLDALPVMELLLMGKLQIPLLTGQEGHTHRYHGHWGLPVTKA